MPKRSPVKTLLLDYSSVDRLPVDLDVDASLVTAADDDDVRDDDLDTNSPAADDDESCSGDEDEDESGDDADDEKSPDDETTYKQFQLGPDRLTADAGSEQKVGGMWALIKSLLVRAVFMYFVSVVLQRERPSVSPAAVNLAALPTDAELYNSSVIGDVL